MSTLELALKTTLARIGVTRYENPVVTKELRTRMRGYKAHWLMLGYVLLLGLVMVIAYYLEWVSHLGTYDPQSWLNARVGFNLFSVLTKCQAVMIVFIAPSLTGGSLTAEREQQTMEMLSLTPLSARNIIAGKVTSVMLFILMLLACSLPLAGICLMFGSISPLEILVSYLLLAAWAFLFSSVGVFFSSLFRRTSAAVLVSFACVAIYAQSTGALGTFLSSAAYTPGPIANWQFVFAGLSGFNATDLCLDIAPVFGVKIPVAIVGIVFSASLGILLLTTATTKLPYHRVQQSVLIRSLLLGISLIGMFLLFGNLISLGFPFGGSSTDEFVLFAFIVLLVIITPFVPIFSTGPLGRGADLFKSLAFGPVRQKMFENRPTGGLWFLVVWWIAGCGVIILSLAIGGSLAASSYGMGMSAYLLDWNKILQTALALLGAAVGIASIGILLSSALPTRQAAFATTLLVVILAWMVFPVLTWQHESSYSYTWSGENGFKWQVAYLWPGLMLLKLTNNWNPGQHSPILWLPDGLTGIGCAMAWGIVAAIALSLAARMNARKGGIPDE